MDLGEPLHTLVIPGRLHFMEAYALVHLAGAPERILQDGD
jgi:diphthine synthase